MAVALVVNFGKNAGSYVKYEHVDYDFRTSLPDLYPPGLVIRNIFTMRSPLRSQATTVCLVQTLRTMLCHMHCGVCLDESAETPPSQLSTSLRYPRKSEGSLRKSRLRPLRLGLSTRVTLCTPVRHVSDVLGSMLSMVLHPTTTWFSANY